MASRYDDRDYRDRQEYGRRGESDYRSSYRDRSQGRYRYDDSEQEGERYGRESDLGGQYSSRYSPTSERGYRNREGEYSSRYSPGYGRGTQSGRESLGSRWEDEDYSGEYRSYPRGYYSGERTEYSGRTYGSSRGYNEEGRYGERSDDYSRRYNYPTGFRSTERYGERGRSDYESSRYRPSGREYEFEQGYGSQQDRGWWDRASDEVASWFGDEEASQRRRMDQRREEFRGRGPKGYRRSDERIKEDVNDRLSEGYLDASEIEVMVENAEVLLTGTVNNRRDKRRAEVLAESITGVTNVENRLRVKQSGLSTSGLDSTTNTGPMATAGPAGTTGTTGIAGTTGTAGTSSSATGTTSSRSRGAAGT